MIILLKVAECRAYLLASYTIAYKPFILSNMIVIDRHDTMQIQIKEND